MAAPKTVQMAPNVPITMTIKYIDLWPNDTTKNNGQGYGASLALRGLIDGEDCRVYPKGFVDRNIRTLMQADVIELGQYDDDPAEKYSIPVNDGADILMTLYQPAGERYPAFTAINPRLLTPPKSVPKPGRETASLGAQQQSDGYVTGDGYMDALAGTPAALAKSSDDIKMGACYGHAIRIIKEAETLAGRAFSSEDIRATAITLFLQGRGR